jgi:hypothetical protein
LAEDSAARVYFRIYLTFRLQPVVQIPAVLAATRFVDFVRPARDSAEP